MLTVSIPCTLLLLLEFLTCWQFLPLAFLPFFKAEAKGRTRGERKGVATVDNSSEAARQQHQKELAKELQEKALKRLHNHDFQEEKSDKKRDNIAYKTPDRFPYEKAVDLKILIGGPGSWFETMVVCRSSPSCLIVRPLPSLFSQTGNTTLCSCPSTA